MAGHTILNLKEIEDAATRLGFAPSLEARFATGALELEKAGLSYQKLAPGFRMPFGHRHKQQEEVYVIVPGSGRVKFDQEIAEVRQWDVLRVPAETMRAFEAGPDGVELLAFGAPYAGPSPGEDAEVQPGWWSD
jgi:mannose-6-phosphate isomerase-like protein (cupin superfamily)